MRQILKTQEPDWLRVFADRLAGKVTVKLAMRSEDLNALSVWNSKTQHEQSDLNELRNILGRISTHLNSVSEIYNYGSRRPTPQYAQQAQQVLPDLANMDALKMGLQQAEQAVTRQFPNLPATQMLGHMIHSIQQSNFTPQQFQTLNSIANSQLQPQQGFREEADPGRLRHFLKQSVYGRDNATSVALRVIREALQNATDAVINRQNKVRDPAHAPTIMIQAHYFAQPGQNGEEQMMDLMISDNGIGMDWSVLSQKFFEYFESGKEGMGGETAGGFGIAKALIQETPQHGWSIETNGLHTSRFGRNMYFGTPVGEQYQPPQSAVQKTPNGTVLTLYGIPQPPSASSIRDLCKNYAIGQVNIVVNGNPVAPRFKLGDLKKLGPNLEGMAAAIADNDTEANVVKEVTETAMLLRKDDWLGDLKFEPAEGKSVNVEFALTRNGYSGAVFVLLNGQYQFEYQEWLDKADLIVNIATNLTPKEQGYPVDPGRENLTQPYRDEVRKTIDFFKKTLRDIAQHALFRDGLNIINYNDTFQPLSTEEGEKENDPNAKAIEDRFSNAFGLAGSSKMFPEQQKSPQELAEALSSVVPTMQLSDEQRSIVNTAVEALENDQRKNIDVKTELKKIIDGLTTPASFIIQKNFISTEALKKNPDLNRHLLMLWQKVIRLVAKTATKYLANAKRENAKAYVPGVIYSDEAIALYQPANPKNGQKHDVVAINPMTVAALTEPDLFQKLILDQEMTMEATPESYGTRPETADISTQDRLIGLLMHEAIHEVTHLIFPDYYGYDTFHKNVSKVENACHFLEPEIRKEVRSHIRGLREQMKKLIRVVAKDKKRMQKEQ